MNPLKMPPFWFLLATLSQFGIAWSSQMPVYSEFRITMGYIFIGVGVVFVLGAWRSFRKWKTPICPFKEPEHMITDGLFAVTRNPVYLGEVVMLMGLAFLHGAWATFLPVPIFVLIIEWVFIRHEEQALKAKYGEEFDRYATRVRKWF